MIPWLSLTSLGGVTVTLPAALAVTAWLASERAWRLAWWWSLLFLAGLTIVVASKIAFVGWGIGSATLDFTGFSGHAMRAAALMPVMLYLMLARRSRQARILGILAGLAFGVLIAVSRLAVNVHSISEVVAGFLLGAAVALTFVALADKPETATPKRWLIALSLAALVLASGQPQAPTQRWVEDFALTLSGRDQPYTKHEWKVSR